MRLVISAWCSVCVAVALAAALPAPPSWAVLKAAYAYTAPAPTVTEVIRPDPEYRLSHIVFTNRKGQSVPGLFLRPKGTGVYPCVLLLHGLGSDKETMTRIFGRALLRPRPPTYDGPRPASSALGPPSAPRPHAADLSPGLSPARGEAPARYDSLRTQAFADKGRGACTLRFAPHPGVCRQGERRLHATIRSSPTRLPTRGGEPIFQHWSITTTLLRPGLAPRAPRLVPAHRPPSADREKW